MRRQQIFIDAVALVGISFVCLLLFLALVPYVLQTRDEARISESYMMVRRLRDAHQASQSFAQTTVEGAVDRSKTEFENELPELDPWLQPYRLVSYGDGEKQCVRVVWP